MFSWLLYRENLRVVFLLYETYPSKLARPLTVAKSKTGGFLVFAISMFVYSYECLRITRIERKRHENRN